MTDRKVKGSYEIETPHGWCKFDGVRRMPEKQSIYKLTTENGLLVEVTKNHKLIVDDEGNTKLLSDLEINTKIYTKQGWDIIQSIEDTGVTDWVYDILEVKNDDHSFYSNDLIHHNCSFIGSSTTLIEGKYLETIRETLPEAPILSRPDMDYYGKCLSGHIYVFSVDVAKGVGGDYSVIQIVDITNPKLYKQVAVFSDNFIDPFKLTSKLIQLSKQWNNPYIIVEVNAYGDEIVRRLWNDFEYENLFYEKRQHRKGHGVYADKRTKAIGTTMLKRHIENKMIYLQDEKTVKELEGFVELRPDIFGCEQGENSHDDRVMSLVWFSYFMESPYWKDIEPYVRGSENINNDESYNNEDEQVFDPIIPQTSTPKAERDVDGFVWDEF